MKLVLACSLLFLHGISNPTFGQYAGMQSDFESFGAEDKGAEDNVPKIPEPLVFDLVRGLGADRGEFEMNILGIFPLKSSSDMKRLENLDPFGLDPTSEDTGGVEWAPEVEYAIGDGFAVEFELPFEDSRLEAYKAAMQLTFGTAFDNRLIHGTQVIAEPDTKFEEWDLTYLYLVGFRFNKTWSTLGMLGLRNNVAEGEGIVHTDGLLNLSIFADVTTHMTVGVESNFTFAERERTSLLLMPQVDYELTDNFQVQCGAGAGFSKEGTEPLAAIRIIYSR